MHTRRSFVAFAIVATAVACSFKTHAAPCKTHGSEAAKELSFDLRDERTLQGLRVSFELSLPRPEFPAKEISNLSAPCSRGQFPGLFHGFELFGENGDLPPRWAIVNGASSPILFVVAMLKPGPAQRWREAKKVSKGSQAKVTRDEWMWALVVNGTEGARGVITYFDQMPDDERLVALMQAVVEPGGPPREIAIFDVNTREIVVSPK